MDNNFETPVVETVVEETPVKSTKGLDITALIFGIISYVPCFAWCALGLGPVVALVLSLISRSKNGGKLTGMAKVALILGIIGIVLTVLGILFYIAYIIFVMVLGGAASSVPTYDSYYSYY